MRFPGCEIGRALEPFTHETLVSPSGEGFQKRCTDDLCDQTSGVKWMN